MSDVFNNMNIPYTAPAVAQQQANVQPVTVKEAVAASSVGEQKTDSVEISTQNKEKKGPIKAAKGFIANIKKFFANVSEYAAGTFEGIKNGVIGASIVYTGGAAINKVRQFAANRAAKKSGEEVAKVVKKIPNKFLAGVVGIGALAASLWTASLNASERSSNIEHRYLGHNNK